MARPVVGVTSSRGGARYMWWFYWLALRLNGVKPVRLIAPVHKVRFSRLDGLVIGGGDDIGAEIYQGEPTLDVRIDPERDAMELGLLEHVEAYNVPVLGVCRGAQMLNVFHGGSLHQDMRAAYANVPRMWTPLPRKCVRIERGTRVAGLLGMEQLTVNSLHRQACDRIGTGLTVSGRDEYGVVQCIEHVHAEFRIGVQWHPEFLIYRASHRRLFAAFVKAVRRHAARKQEAGMSGGAEGAADNG
ncbi:MAG: gamma-glutamyl-gamma-aminobutyrate hydrolase family protein [Alphaproteobacteria bacterium]